MPVPVSIGTQGGVALTRDSDAPPFVRWIAHVLALNTWDSTRCSLLQGLVGTIAVATDSDQQRALITAAGGHIHVGGGESQPPKATIVLSLDSREVSERVPSTGQQDVISVGEVLMQPPLPDWENLTDSFWTLTRQVRGLPALSLQETSSGCRIRLGEGPGAPYEVHGSARELSRFLAGMRFFPEAVYAGDLQIRGTFSQFSTVSGASLKVMFDV
ncbi:hypothetical protein [Kineococcus rhizosphaerae]|uniref:hypothetical protein n=1 Tax=Kineococcus rhizosphaerae TaxID=559628 RepID=UPI000D0689A5|nr:hypothetical protein [Kineococcus rhizosphaerae]